MGTVKGIKNIQCYDHHPFILATFSSSQTKVCIIDNNLPIPASLQPLVTSSASASVNLTVWLSHIWNFTVFAPLVSGLFHCSSVSRVICVVVRVSEFLEERHFHSR